uniref:uncharacterized protein n=1 Tax=Semicossyphus pulcher TaxID=241346 RepID=UPI0037E773E4
MKAHEDFQEKENKISQGSDVTPGQKTNPVISEESRACPLTPTDGRENLTKLNKKVKRYKISTLEHTPKNQGSPARQTQALFFSPSPPHLSSSHAADNLDLQLKPDPNCVSESVCAVAARLPECLQFPLVRKKNLVAESREVLLKALRERHGPRLQENLFKLQRCLSFGSDPTKEVQDQEPTVIEEDELQCTDALSTEFHSSEPFFDDPRTKSFKRKGSVYFHWKSSPQLLQKLTQPAEWFKRPEETSASLLDDILRPPCSPQFCMDFEPSGINDHLFAPSPTSCRGERASTSPHWGDTSKRPKSKETFMFNSFEHGLMNHTRALGGPQYGNSSTQPLFPHRAQLPETHSTEPMHFPRKQDPLETKRHSFAPSFSSQILGPEQSHSFQPFSQFSHPSACPPLRSHHTDMSHYPPSHMLERDPAPSRSSLLSPEHWSFPPMRLF